MATVEKEFNISFFRRLFTKHIAEQASTARKKLPVITQEQRIEILKALADETRLSIIHKLIREGGAVASCDITACASVHALSQPAMSHHFSKLVDAGVVTETKQGTQKLYELNCDLLASAGINITNL